MCVYAPNMSSNFIVSMDRNPHFFAGRTRSNNREGGQMDVLLGIPDGQQTSGSFSEIKSFAKKFARGLSLGSNQIRMGVFSYGDSARSVLEVRSGTSSSSVETAIDNMRHNGGPGNRKDRAVRYASQMFGRSPRSGVSKKVVLLSHGPSSSGSADLSTISESYPDMEVHPVAVGPDAQIDAALLSDDYKYYEDFPELTSSGPFDITSTIIPSGSTRDGTGKLYRFYSGALNSPLFFQFAKNRIEMQGRGGGVQRIRNMEYASLPHNILMSVSRHQKN